MPLEIEAKMAVPALDPLRDRLKDCGAAHVGDFLETNTFFDTEDRSLLAADEGLRLRVNRDTATGRETHIITFKGPRQAGPLKSRDEVELEVGEPQAAMTLLERLGFHRVLSFEKKRQSWKLDDCKIELDEVPHLGFFMEIEGPSEETVMRTRQRLGMDDRPIVKASYIALLLGHLQERGKSSKSVTFGEARG